MIMDYIMDKLMGFILIMIYMMVFLKSMHQLKYDKEIYKDQVNGIFVGKLIWNLFIFVIDI